MRGCTSSGIARIHPWGGRVTRRATPCVAARHSGTARIHPRDGSTSPVEPRHAWLHVVRHRAHPPTGWIHVTRRATPCVAARCQAPRASTHGVIASPVEPRHAWLHVIRHHAHPPTGWIHATRRATPCVAARYPASRASTHGMNPRHRGCIPPWGDPPRHPAACGWRRGSGRWNFSLALRQHSATVLVAVPFSGRQAFSATNCPRSANSWAKVRP